MSTVRTCTYRVAQKKARKGCTILLTYYEHNTPETAADTINDIIITACLCPTRLPPPRAHKKLALSFSLLLRWTDDRYSASGLDAGAVYLSSPTTRSTAASERTIVRHHTNINTGTGPQVSLVVPKTTWQLFLSHCCSCLLLSSLGQALAGMKYNIIYGIQLL